MLYNVKQQSSPTFLGRFIDCSIKIRQLSQTLPLIVSALAENANVGRITPKGVKFQGLPGLCRGPQYWGQLPRFTLSLKRSETLGSTSKVSLSLYGVNFQGYLVSVEVSRIEVNFQGYRYLVSVEVSSIGVNTGVNCQGLPCFCRGQQHWGQLPMFPCLCRGQQH